MLAYVVSMVIALALISFVWIKKDAPRNANIIVVLSGPYKFVTKQRIENAVSLYNQHYSRKILVTGKYLSKWMKQELINSKIPKNSILIQNKSTNTYEDALYNIKFLKKCRVILLVTSSLHQRRANKNFSKVFKNLMVINTPADDHFTITGFLSPICWVKTISEIIKFLIY